MTGESTVTQTTGGSQTNAGNVHVHDDCHRLIRYPDDFEFTKSMNFESTVKGNAVIPKEEAEDVIAQYGDAGNNNYAQYLSKEQYSNLLITVTHTGNFNILPNLTLYNVLHDLSLRKEQVFGEVGDGLYLLKPSRKESQTSSNIVSFQKRRNSIVVSIELLNLIV
ncbi:hypothetical protein H5410_042100 [Solanum commersonii]|uniref:Uncharacterized protein n=1 Tax=Solanum commersonii TaxID=4109 RepID=A0A9J5XV09_SOLCO|nr:hypothetical protein H5410_042100 [Solanum commersonii]